MGNMAKTTNTSQRKSITGVSSTEFRVGTQAEGFFHPAGPKNGGVIGLLPVFHIHAITQNKSFTTLDPEPPRARSL